MVIDHLCCDAFLTRFCGRVETRPEKTTSGRVRSDASKTRPIRAPVCRPGGCKLARKMVSGQGGGGLTNAKQGNACTQPRSLPHEEMPPPPHTSPPNTDWRDVQGPTALQYDTDDTAGTVLAAYIPAPPQQRRQRAPGCWTEQSRVVTDPECRMPDAVMYGNGDLCRCLRPGQSCDYIPFADSDAFYQAG
eukprot:gene9867-biopygen6229